MLISTIESSPFDALGYMERYVNDGSPSGYSFNNSSSELTRPRSDTKHFPLIAVQPYQGVAVHNLGLFPSHLFGKHDNVETMFVHPDMLVEPNLLALSIPERRSSSFVVQPTASARTMQILDDAYSGYLKLHYESHLGRIKRQMTLRHAQSAIENTRILDFLVDRDLMPTPFAYFPEQGARVYEGAVDQKTAYLGMVWRPNEIKGKNALKIAFLVPAFSLFAKDLKHPNEPTLLDQLGAIRKTSKASILLDELLLPVIDSYFDMLIYGGLQGEWHAQNVLYAFDLNWRCVAIVLRDMESVDRDMPFMKQALHEIKIESYPYKCVMDNEYYAIRHSFMFDYKFGEYLIAPLIDHAVNIWGLDERKLVQAVVEVVMNRLSVLPKNFFPANGSWYRFANQLIDQTKPERPYVRMSKPRFRDTMF